MITKNGLHWTTHLSTPWNIIRKVVPVNPQPRSLMLGFPHVKNMRNLNTVDDAVRLWNETGKRANFTSSPNLHIWDAETYEGMVIISGIH
jgi:hypothetical protein